MKFNSKLFAVYLVVAFAFSTNSFAQCKQVVTDGINKLSPYSFNGQINNLTLKGGKASELHLIFYKGYTYKIQLGSEAPTNTTFRVLDENKKEVFNSTANGTSVDSWTFFSNSPQELIIEVTSTDKAKVCAAVLVGVQVPKNNHSMRYL